MAVWTAPVTAQTTPEEAFVTLGGGRGKLQRFFAGPRASAPPTGASSDPSPIGRPGDPGTALAVGIQDQGARTKSAGSSDKQSQLQSSPFTPGEFHDPARAGGEIIGERPAASGSQASEHVAKRPRLEGQAGGPGARKDAFAVMMAARKQSSVGSSPASQARPPGGAVGGWSDELRKVALQPNM